MSTTPEISKKILKNSKAIYFAYALLGAIFTGLVNLVISVNKVTKLPPIVENHEARIIVLEQQNLVFNELMKRIVQDIADSKKDIKSDLDIIKNNLTAVALDNREKITRVIYEYPHKEKEIELKRKGDR